MLHTMASWHLNRCSQPPNQLSVNIVVAKLHLLKLIFRSKSRNSHLLIYYTCTASFGFSLIKSIPPPKPNKKKTTSPKPLDVFRFSHNVLTRPWHGGSWSLHTTRQIRWTYLKATRAAQRIHGEAISACKSRMKLLKGWWNNESWWTTTATTTTTTDATATAATTTTATNTVHNTTTRAPTKIQIIQVLYNKIVTNTNTNVNTS